MKQKLLSGLIALFLCLSNVSAGDNLNNIFKKYQKYKGEEIICEQLDLPKELRKAKAGKTSKDINISQNACISRSTYWFTIKTVRCLEKLDSNYSGKGLPSDQCISR